MFNFFVFGLKYLFFYLMKTEELERGKSVKWIQVVLHKVYLIIHFFLFQLHGVDDNISRSKRLIISMSRRMSRNKWIVGAIISVLVLAIMLILYFKFSK